MSADLKDSMAAGFVKHLIKPVGIGTFRQAIQNLAAAGVPGNDAEVGRKQPAANHGFQRSP